MANVRFLKAPLLSDGCKYNLTFIHESLQQIERAMLEGYRNERKIEELKPQYVNKIAEVTKLLKDLSVHLFLSVNIEHVRAYSSDEAIPKDYHAYTLAFQNLTSLVQVSIFAPDKIELSLLAMERWIIILKDCFESGDFFTSSAIVYALSKYQVSNTKLYDHLSDMARSILDFYQGIFAKQHRIHTLQMSKLGVIETVVPQLASLSFLIDRNKEEAQAYVASYIKIKKQIGNMPSVLAAELASHLSVPWGDKDIKMIDACSKRMIESISSNQSKLSCDMKILSMAFRLYNKSDLYYIFHHDYEQAITGLKNISAGVEKESAKSCMNTLISILSDSSYAYTDKLACFEKFIDLNSKLFSKKVLKQEFKQVKDALQSLVSVQDTWLLLQPDIKLKILDMNTLMKEPSHTEDGSHQAGSTKKSSKRYSLFGSRSKSEPEDAGASANSHSLGQSTGMSLSNSTAGSDTK